MSLLHCSCLSDLKEGCQLEACSSQVRNSRPPRVGLLSDADMSIMLWSPQTPGITAVSCYATSLPRPHCAHRVSVRASRDDQFQLYKRQTIDRWKKTSQNDDSRLVCFYLRSRFTIFLQASVIGRRARRRLTKTL